MTMQGMVEALRHGHASEFTDTQVSASLLRKDARPMLHTSDEPLAALAVAFDALTDEVRADRGEEDFSVMASADRG